MTSPDTPAVTGLPDDAVRGALALAHVNEQATQLRIELAQLRHQLTQIERSADARNATEIGHARHRLQDATDQADAIASAAAVHLSDMVAAGPSDGLARLMREGEENPSRPITGELKVLREANEQLLIAALESQKEEAAAMDAHRRQIGFLATVAHELRNPLVPLRLAAAMLDRARTDEVAYSKLRTTITGQVAQMSRLIGDLLEGSRIRMGGFRLERTLIDLRDVLRRAIETCQSPMDERRQRFTAVMPDQPVMVLGDTVRLVQVFGNLLGNSSKYTLPDGRIHLSVQALASAVTVTIEDDGIGITAEALPHVFDMFVRDAHAMAIDDGGLGIGLAVVRELVRAHEGGVVAHSDGEGRGSIFVVTLPVVAGAGRRLTESGPP